MFIILNVDTSPGLMVYFGDGPIIYDVIFVLPNLLHNPTGGDRDVSMISARLRRDGFKVAVVYIRDPLKRLNKLVKSRNLKSVVKNRRKREAIYYNLMSSRFGYLFLRKLVRTLLKIDFYEDFEGIHVYFAKSLEKIPVGLNMIAQSWEASFFVFYQGRAVNKFYNVHHSVDDETFSGNLSGIAKESFNLQLKKIVESDALQRRFRDEDPLRIDKGIDTVKFKCKVLPENREDVVLFPFRTNKSKGAEVAIQCCNLIHGLEPGIKIVGFGNYPKEKIPNFVEYRGRVSDGELVDLYNMSSITVIPSTVEGTSFPALEAMSCGSCLVSTEN